MDNENSNNYNITDSPTNRPTLSTSTSSFEALNTHDPLLSRLATKMFHKSSEFVTYEMVSSLEDYKLLENMNKVTVSKYSDMKQIADNLANSTDDLKIKFNDLVCFLICLYWLKVQLINLKYLTASTIETIEWYRWNSGKTWSCRISTGFIFTIAGD